jgi:hypothetical protein
MEDSMNTRRLLGAFVILLAGFPPAARAYVEAPHSLGMICNLSTNIVLMRVEKVDKDKNLIIFRKVRDIKGVHPTDVIKHNIGRGGYNPREWQYIMDWAEVGKTAVFCHNGGESETCIGNYWYQTGNGGEWWNLTHGEPFLMRSYYGSTDKLASLFTEMLAGKEVIVPCMMDGNKDDLHLRRAKVERLKASLKLDYNEKRDFVGLGGEDFRRLSGMPGFTHYSALARVDADAQAVSCLDIDGDGKPDVCLAGAGRVVILQNAGESLNEISIPGLNTGCRAAVWADYNGDGKPDLLLATMNGPKLYTNLGNNLFRDDSHLLPRQPGWNLTAAAWIDYDGDGKPDILLGNGFHGLRLYRNKGAVDGAVAPLKLGKWSYVGPFPNVNGQGFAAVYPPEQGVNLTQKFGGKNGEEATWKEGKFNDGEVNNLALFKPENNVDSVVYLYREIESDKARELPVSLGSDDTLTVWLNGEKIVSENVARACAADQTKAVFKLKKGKNTLLMKVCQGGGEWAFYFKASDGLPPAITWAFEDVSDAVGLGANGIGSTVKGDSLVVCDVDGDGRPDFLYSAGSGMLVMNTPKGFVEVKDSGISYKAGKVGPVFGDYDNDGLPDLFVPQKGGCKLFHNEGGGKFTDVTAKAGLDKFTGWATSAAWGDVDNDGKLDLVVGCLRGTNRFFRNKGDGTFEDASEAIGLSQRIFNTQAVGLVDLNGDGVLDMVFNNEGQESCVLLGNPEWVAKRTPVTLRVAGKEGVVGSKVKVTDKDGKLVGIQQLSGGDGRGGQASPTARFALAPGTYRVEVVFSNGDRRAKQLVVAGAHIKGVIDEQTPKAD